MKIVFFMSTPFTHAGGIESYFISTARYLNTNSEHSITLVSMDIKFSEKIRHILQILHLKKFKPLANQPQHTTDELNYIQCSTFLDLSNVLEQYDLVYSKNEVLDAIIIILAKILSRKNFSTPPTVFCCGTPLHNPQFSSNSARKFLRKLLYQGIVYKILTFWIKGFHVKNKADEMIVRKLFPEKIVSLIPNSIDINDFDTNFNESKYFSNLDKKKTNIVWIGRLTKEKGIVLFNEIIREINIEHKSKVAWHIFGQGEEEKTVMELASIEGNLTYHGYVKNCYIPSILGNMDLLILTSEFETFSFTALEAQLANIPVVSFNIPGPREIVIHNETGYLYNDKDELIRYLISFLNDRPKYNDIRARAKESFNKKVLTDKLLALFNKVVHG